MGRPAMSEMTGICVCSASISGSIGLSAPSIFVAIGLMSFDRKLPRSRRMLLNPTSGTRSRSCSSSVANGLDLGLSESDRQSRLNCAVRRGTAASSLTDSVRLRLSTASAFSTNLKTSVPASRSSAKVIWFFESSSVMRWSSTSVFGSVSDGLTTYHWPLSRRTGMASPASSSTGSPPRAFLPSIRMKPVGDGPGRAT